MARILVPPELEPIFKSEYAKLKSRLPSYVELFMTNRNPAVPVSPISYSEVKNNVIGITVFLKSNVPREEVSNIATILREMGYNVSVVRKYKNRIAIWAWKDLG